MSFIEGVGKHDPSSATSQTTGTLSSSPSQDNLVLLFVYLQNGDAGSRSITWPSGFTQLFVLNDIGGSGHTHAAAWKLAGASEPTSYSYSWDGTSYTQDSYLQVRDGVNTSTPIGTSPTTSDNGYGSSHTVNSITTATDGELAIHSFAGQAAATATPPSGWTERHDADGSLYMMEKEVPSAGSVGGETISHNSGYNASATFSINQTVSVETTINPATLNLSGQQFTIQPGAAETAVNPATLNLSPQPFTIQPGTAETAVNPATLNLSPQAFTVEVGNAPQQTTINPATLGLTGQQFTVDLPAPPETTINPATLNLSGQQFTVDLPAPPETTINPATLNLSPQAFTVQPGAAETTINPTTLGLTGQQFTIDLPAPPETTINPATLNLAGQQFSVTGGVLPLQTTINPATLNLSPQPFAVQIIEAAQETTINPAVLNLSPLPLVVYNVADEILVGDATPLDIDVNTDSITDHVAGTHVHKVIASSNPGANESYLQTDVNGYLQLERLGLGVAPTERLDVAGNIQLTGLLKHTNDLVIEPAGNDVLIRTADLAAENWVSGTTGWGIQYDGDADFRNITADSLTVEAFISDINLALAGSQFITKSLAILSRNFTIPSGNATLYVYDLPGFANTQVFENGDYVRLRYINIGTGLVVGDAWGTVNTYNDLGNGEQSWKWTRVSGSTGKVIYAGSIALDYGQSGDGYWHVTTLDPAGSPYAEIGTWATDPSVPANHTIHTRLGQLDGIAGVGNEWGLWSGQDATHYLLASDTNLEAHGIRISLYDGVTERIRLDPSVPSMAIGDPMPTSLTVGDGLWAGKHSDSNYYLRIGKGNAQRLEWDSSDLILYDNNNAPVIVLDASGTSYFAGPMTIGSNGGIWQGSGSFASPVTGLKLWNDAGIGRLAGYNNSTLQAEFATDGSIKAGAGGVILSENGIRVRTPSEAGQTARKKIGFAYDNTAESNIVTFVYGGLTYLYLRTEGTSDDTIFAQIKMRTNNDLLAPFPTLDSEMELTADTITVDATNTYITHGLNVGTDPYTAADGWIIVKGNVEVRRGISVDGNIQAAQGQISVGDDVIFGGNLVYRYGTGPLDYTRVSGYVPLISPLTNTAWDGDHKTPGNYTITVSNWGVPSGATAVTLDLRGQPTNASTVVYLGGGASPVFQWNFLSSEVNQNRQIYITMPLLSNGTFLLTVSNYNFNWASLKITGYFI